MQANDAATALRVTYEAIKLLSKLTFELVSIVTYEGEKTYKILFQSEGDVEDLLSGTDKPSATNDTKPPGNGV